MHFSFDFTYFKEVWQKYRNIFVRFLVQMKTSKFAFEIDWPLVCLKLQKPFWAMHFFFSTKPHNCPHPNSTLYTLSKERVGRLKHFSISCMLPQNRATARCAVLKHQHCIQKTIFYLFIYTTSIQYGLSMTLSHFGSNNYNVDRHWRFGQ